MPQPTVGGLMGKMPPKLGAPGANVVGPGGQMAGMSPPGSALSMAGAPSMPGAGTPQLGAQGAQLGQAVSSMGGAALPPQPGGLTTQPGGAIEAQAQPFNERAAWRQKVQDIAKQRAAGVKHAGRDFWASGGKVEAPPQGQGDIAMDAKRAGLRNSMGGV